MVSAEFQRLWMCAGRYLQSQLRGRKVRWLRTSLSDVAGEHFSFILDNEPVFIHVTASGVISPGTPKAMLRMARAWDGVGCILSMQRDGLTGGWVAKDEPEGLYAPDENWAVDLDEIGFPEPPVMKDWELHDLAIQIVRQYIEQRLGGRTSSYQSDPELYPSIWFDRGNGHEAVIVACTTFPALAAPQPAAAHETSAMLNSRGVQTHFASVSIAAADDSFDEETERRPLFRGDGVIPRFTGLQPL